MSTVRLSGWISSVFFQEETMIFAAILLVAAVIVFIRSKGRERLRIGSFVVALFCLIYLVFITTLIIGFGSNGTRPNRIELAEQSTYTVNEVEAIELVVEEASHSGATYSIINNSDKMIVYSHGYHLDTEKNGVWYRLKDDGMIVLTVRPGTSPGGRDTYNCKWKDSYGRLPEGHYRLVKKFGFDGEFEKYYMAAEFTLD